MSILVVGFMFAIVVALATGAAFKQGVKDGYARALEDVKRELTKTVVER